MARQQRIVAQSARGRKSRPGAPRKGAADANLPGIGFLDIGLPGVNGYDVARRLRAAENRRRALVIALSDYATAEDIQRSKQAGFDLHFVKPIDFEQLDRVLARQEVP